MNDALQAGRYAFEGRVIRLTRDMTAGDPVRRSDLMIEGEEASINAEGPCPLLRRFISGGWRGAVRHE